MKSIKFVFAAAMLSLGLSGCVQSSEEVNVKEDKLEAPADETSIENPDIPANEELESNILKDEEMDSDEDPIMDTMR